MTDPKALIAEAREKERQLNKLCRAMLNLKNEKAARDAADHAGLLLRLAAALEEATKARMTFAVSGGWKAIPDLTAREAMAALNGKAPNDQDRR